MIKNNKITRCALLFDCAIILLCIRHVTIFASSDSTQRALFYILARESAGQEPGAGEEREIVKERVGYIREARAFTRFQRACVAQWNANRDC